MKMIKAVGAVMLMMLLTPVYATNPSPPPFDNGGDQEQSQDQQQAQSQDQTAVGVGIGTGIGVSGSSSSADSSSQGGDARSGSSSSASGGNATSSNHLSNVGNWRYRESERPVDSAYAPSINPTSPCMGSSSAGGQGMNIGISMGTTWTDKECEKREAFRMGVQSGDPDIAAAAKRVYMSLDAVQAALRDGTAEEAVAGQYDGAVADTAGPLVHRP